MLFVQSPMLLAMLGIIVYVGMRNRTMKRRQDLLVAQLKGKRYWRINLASPAFFEQFLRLMPFEAKGVLIEDDDAFRVQGNWLKSGAAFESKVLKADCTVEWLGNKTLRAGNLFWAKLNTPKGPILFCPDTGMSALPSREALADIFRSAFPDFTLTANEEKEFALEKNPRSLAAVVIFLGLLLFALLDTYVFSSYELVDSQIFQILMQPLVLLGVPLGGLALIALLYRLFSTSNIPARESVVLSMMLAVVVAASSLPVLKRLDQVLADSPSVDYDYLVTSVGHLEPVDKSQGLPKMKFLRANEYWAQFPAGSKYVIPFLHGPMGLWQLDHTRFDPPVMAYYDKHESGK